MTSSENASSLVVLKVEVKIQEKTHIYATVRHGFACDNLGVVPSL